MRLQLVALLMLLLPAMQAWPQAKSSSSEYTILLATLKGGNTTVDYGRLRLSYPDSPEYKAAKDVTGDERAMFKALQAKDYSAALKHAQTVLDNEYVNIDAHYVAYLAYQEMNLPYKAAFHLAIFRGLINSILKSGDGKSPQTAWVIISVHEEYVILRVLGFSPSQQSLLYKNGHAYDMMKVKNSKDGSARTFYFNTDIPIKEEGF